MKTNKISRTLNAAKTRVKPARYFLLVILGNLVLMQSLHASDNLVNVNWLKENLKNPDILLIDASPTQLYAAKHIPGAINIDYFTFGLWKMSVAETEKLYQSWGLSSEKKIVIYDQGGEMFAPRLFFTLYYHGFPEKNLLILDGGLSKWEEEGLPVTKDITPAPEKSSFTISKLKNDAKIELPEFLAASGDLDNNVLLEALDPDWHFGETLAYGRTGHIPNAIMMPRTDFYNPDKTFKSVEEIQKMLSYYNIKPEQKIHTHCGGGVAATVPFFALKFLLNYPEVTLFEESQHGWLADERELPFWTYDAPFLMRETDWVKSWGGKMMRMYRGALISVVDIRSKDAFNQGHVPFAINIPANLFKSNITNPVKLTEILGPAGVNAFHETIIISGDGLTKDAALAFVLLEKLGQEKVSIFIDHLDKWTQSGSKLTKEATVVGPKKHLYDLSIVPATYPQNFRKDVIITDAKSTQGLYPKVLIASGANMPEKAPEGDIIHIPYTNLLNADGRPKAAKDIWNILSKAGVPRYAELVCYSDDPGEAAINYFILKLMGYPDIKMLVNK